ncbi:hypothetical protein L1049_004037 [Liquidambar formosana]|uniref:Translocator protein homolog n=1 Tax=Liquidambar formosana TaxID=63359 RepID=A0AAP0RNU6_LIQFO
MESQDIKQHTRDDDPNKASPATTTDNNNRDKRKAKAKRGLKSLTVMVTAPVLFTLTSLYLFGSGQSYSKLAKPYRLPPLWALHLTSFASALLMGLSAWLFWADGGFHRKPRAFHLYVAWLVLHMAWEPIVLEKGASRAGLAVCVAMIGALVGCSRNFREVNQIAGDLGKPCLALAGFLGFVNLKLACL